MKKYTSLSMKLFRGHDSALRLEFPRKYAPKTPVSGNSFNFINFFNFINLNSGSLSTATCDIHKTVPQTPTDPKDKSQLTVVLISADGSRGVLLPSSDQTKYSHRIPPEGWHQHSKILDLTLDHR
jgi:hypothetical protein